MNKKYMDFVPAKTKKAQSTSKIVTIQSTQTETVSLVEQEIPNPKTASLSMPENLSARFVKTDVPKRPLSQKPLTTNDTPTKPKLLKPKPRKISKASLKQPSSPTPMSAPMPAPKEMSLNMDSSSNAYQAPKTHFINQEKVAKRPLSGNIHTKESKVSKKPVSEPPQKPIMVTPTPAKKSHFKTILMILAAIIVGAAAGAAAFLILPK